MKISITTKQDNRTISIERDEDDPCLGLMDYIVILTSLGLPTDELEEQILIIAKNINQKNGQKDKK
jgi:hypothetical protein